MPTKRTTQEAKDYIDATIKFWEGEGRESKIVSLAIIAERWRNNKGGPMAKIKALNKYIRSIQVLIDRQSKIGPTNFEGPLYQALVEAQVELDGLVNIHGMPKGLKVGNGVKITPLPTSANIPPA